ncbi:MAG: hypothetical protein WDN69_08745 [Aliidongia sp.]
MPEGGHVSGSTAGAALRGNFGTPQSGYLAAHTTEANLSEGQKLRNDAKILTSAQVTLRVRFAEVDRTIMKALGFNWNNAIKVGQFSFGQVIGRQAFSGTPPQIVPDRKAAPQVPCSSAGVPAGSTHRL